MSLRLNVLPIQRELRTVTRVETPDEITNILGEHTLPDPGKILPALKDQVILVTDEAFAVKSDFPEIINLGDPAVPNYNKWFMGAPKTLQTMLECIKYEAMWKPRNDLTIGWLKQHMGFIADATAGKTMVAGGKTFRNCERKNWICELDRFSNIDFLRMTYHDRENDQYMVLQTSFFLTSLEAAIKNAVRGNLLIKVKTKNLPFVDKQDVTPQELKARDLLRDMLTEREWRRYCTTGFIMVRGVSGKWYQIFGIRGYNINVYQDNKKVNSLCIHTHRDCPPTDHVVNMKLLVEMDEAAVWSGSNARGADILRRSVSEVLSQPQSLLEIYKSHRTRDIWKSA